MEDDELERRDFDESEDEEYGPAPKRIKRHKFRTFAQRVKHVSYVQDRFWAMIN